MEGHPYARRLSNDEAQLVEDLSRKNVKPRDILSMLKQDPDNVTTLKTIYNARNKFRMLEKGGKTQMQVVLSFLHDECYIYQRRADPSTNQLEDLFFAHPKSLEMWLAFPHVVLIDATYQTNKYALPLLEIVGVTPTNMTFCIAFVLMHKEDESNYTWALSCLKSLMGECILPRVIVTDRDLALMKACNVVFPDAKKLLCTWHIYNNILKKGKKSIRSKSTWNSFNKAWTKLVASQTEDEYSLNFAELEAILLDYPGFFAYLNKVWLASYKEMFVYCWTDKFLNFGNHTTNRVESQHAKLKRYLDSSKLDLEKTIKHIHQVIQSQVTSIKASIEQSKIVCLHRFSLPHLKGLRGFVSIHALNIIFKEYERVKDVGLLAENCGCQLRTSHGLPCAHKQAMYLYKCQPVPLDSLDLFWRKLDLSPCISMKDEDIGCEAELEMLNMHFKKQPRSGKLSLLRKFMEIIAPSTTSVREPNTHTATRGRPSLKTQSFRKTRVEQPPLPQERRRFSCSSASKFVDVDTFGEYQEPGRHSCYSSEPVRHNYYFHPYLNQFPNIFHPYITHLQDVVSDGNCGFRAIAACLNQHEDEWPSIRYNLVEELNMYREEYVDMFGIEQWYQTYNSLNFFESGKFAPIEHWMGMPETGVLVASRYNVILHLLTNAGSMTFLPLRSSPPPWYEHVAIAIGHVNGNHFVKISLAEGYPMPRIMPQWTRFKYDCATAWATPYMTRINKYEHWLSRNHATDFVYLG